MKELKCDKDFEWKNIDDIWCPQENEWTCFIGALKIVLRYYGCNIVEKNLLNSLEKLNLKTFDFGLFLSYTGCLARLLGFNVTYRMARKTTKWIGIEKLPKNINIKSILRQNTIKLDPESPYRFMVKSLLLILDKKGKIIVYKWNNKPDISTIFSIVKRDRPIIVRVVAEEYYNLPNEKWGHGLVLIPSANGFSVFDCYKNRGYSEYDNWEKHLEYAKSFNWEKWCDDLVEIY